MAAKGDEQPERKSDRTRRRLLDAAAAVISRKGYAGTRLADITAAAQIRPPAIYYYFDSLDDLIEEVMYSGATQMRDHLLERLDALPAGATPRDRLAAAVEAHLRMELGISDYSTTIIRNANQLPDDVARRALKIIGEYNAVWRQLLAELRTASELAPDLEPATARMLVLGALNWAAEWYDPQRGPIDDVITTAQSLILRGLTGDDRPTTR
jgi:TetR/AcrR family transcriptional regulator, cholesterol catabolism regulator